jgi:ketopantoate hydroxymethyltransferase
LRGAHALSQDELAILLEEAIDSSTLSATEAQDIALADMVVHGQHHEDGAEVYLVVEVSWGVCHEDVTRAVRRAALFACTGVTTISVVAGQWVTADAARLARADKVWQLTDWHAVLPESATAPS